MEYGSADDVIDYELGNSPVDVVNVERQGRSYRRQPRDDMGGKHRAAMAALPDPNANDVTSELPLPGESLEVVPASLDEIENFFNVAFENGRIAATLDAPHSSGLSDHAVKDICEVILFAGEIGFDPQHG
jgi:hypothetical protein